MELLQKAMAALSHQRFDDRKLSVKNCFHVSINNPIAVQANYIDGGINLIVGLV